MSIVDKLLLLGGIASAITGICLLVRRVIKTVKSWIDIIHSFVERLNTLVEHDNAQYLAILRLTIINESMPMSERLIAGQKYIEKGGNGDVMALYQELEKRCNGAKQNTTDE